MVVRTLAPSFARSVAAFGLTTTTSTVPATAGSHRVTSKGNLNNVTITVAVRTTIISTVRVVTFRGKAYDSRSRKDIYGEANTKVAVLICVTRTTATVIYNGCMAARTNADDKHVPIFFDGSPVVAPHFYKKSKLLLKLTKSYTKMLFIRSERQLTIELTRRD